MKRLLLILLLLIPFVSLAADSFDKRARAAHRLEHADSQRTYQAALNMKLRPKMNRIIAGCRGSTNGSAPRSFALVADITRASSLEHIEVKPSTAFTKCFVSALSRLSFPSPPKSYKGDSYPFALEINFHQH